MAASFCGCSHICHLKAIGKLSPEWSVPWVQLCCFQGGLGGGAGQQPAVLRMGARVLGAGWYSQGKGTSTACGCCLKLRPAAMATIVAILINWGDSLSLCMKHKNGSLAQYVGCSILNALTWWISCKVLKFQSGFFPLISSVRSTAPHFYFFEPYSSVKIVTVLKYHLQNKLYMHLCAYTYIYTYILHWLLTWMTISRKTTIIKNKSVFKVS